MESLVKKSALTGQIIHTPGPIAVGDDGEIYSASRHQSIAMTLMTAEGATNARLLAAAYNAFDSAGKALGVNAVELSERMQDGGISDLVNTLQQVDDFFTALGKYTEDYPGGVHTHKIVQAALAKVKDGAS